MDWWNGPEIVMMMKTDRWEFLKPGIKMKNGGTKVSTQTVSWSWSLKEGLNLRSKMYVQVITHNVLLSKMVKFYFWTKKHVQSTSCGTRKVSFTEITQLFISMAVFSQELTKMAKVKDNLKTFMLTTQKSNHSMLMDKGTSKSLKLLELMQFQMINF